MRICHPVFSRNAAGSTQLSVCVLHLLLPLSSQTSCETPVEFPVLGKIWDILAMEKRWTKAVQVIGRCLNPAFPQERISSKERSTDDPGLCNDKSRSTSRCPVRRLHAKMGNVRAELFVCRMSQMKPLASLAMGIEFLRGGTLWLARAHLRSGFGFGEVALKERIEHCKCLC